ncbi:MAG: 2-C-methyl-D-erythritol 4-phosphate cytidylyltransferase [Firmicutes bacterium]|nr:2-C-methyl-D-erythritol 4-phosphate cytidylyltransferase [Bacillota bacterium]HKM16863.1 2-C-methyl-D-erythritol 4-phosphate cytidylyltransferase [Limnochordia bacterium]
MGAGVIIAAAGSGERLGLNQNKILLPLDGVPILVRSIKAFTVYPWVKEIIVVVREEDYRMIQGMLEQWQIKAQLAIGGPRRQDSVAAGIAALRPDLKWVFIHDAARPLVEPGIIAEAYSQVQEHQAVGVAVPVKDTIKLVDEERFVVGTPPRPRLWAIQTPQVFSSGLIKKAYKRAQRENWEATDDCSLVELLGVKVKLILGSYGNIKITTAEDLDIADAIIGKRSGVDTMDMEKFLESRSVRVGIGCDVHRLVANRPLILGGVTLDYHLGLEGHSDADAAVHALMDALLGAAGLGDIGRHFPDTDPRYKGISSIVFLEQVTEKLNQLGCAVGNADLVIVAQQPRLAGYTAQMKRNLAKAMKIPESRINIKATTTEGLGFCGRGEGIAAWATVTVLC